MAYSVDIIYSKNADYSNPQTVSEAGQPLSIELTNLESDQAYYIKAVLKNDGATVDEDTDKFTTLSAVDYKIPFTVENIDSETGVFTFKHWSNMYSYYSYSIDDGNTWNDVTIRTSDIKVDVPSGGKIQILGNNTSGGMVLSTDNHAAFTFSKKFNVYGNIVSLFDKENYETLTGVNISNAGVGRQTFFGLLRDNTNLESAENLNFGKLIQASTRCVFGNMFYGCSNLKFAPKTIGIYSSGGASSVFNGMFWGCSQLITVPFFENGYEISREVDSTFKGMFRGCSSLKNGLDMRKFAWSGNISYDNSQFSNMYYDCSSLTLVYAPNVTGTYNGTFNGWLTNVSQNGTLHKRTLLSLPTDSADGVPSGWTVTNHLYY